MADAFGSIAPNPVLAGRQPGATYNTQLNPFDEMAYRAWVAQNQVPTNPNSTATPDYDMRGFFRGLLQQNPKAHQSIDPNDSRMHYTDFWKTPQHDTFSSDSQWAPANAPQWTPADQLVSQSGRVVYDDRKKPTLADLLGPTPPSFGALFPGALP